MFILPVLVNLCRISYLENFWKKFQKCSGNFTSLVSDVDSIYIQGWTDIRSSYLSFAIL